MCIELMLHNKNFFDVICQAYHKVVKNLFSLYICRPEETADIWCFAATLMLQ